MASYGADWQVRLGRYWCGLEGVGVVRQARRGAVWCGMDGRGAAGVAGTGIVWLGMAGKARRRTALLGVERQARRRKVGYVGERRGRCGRRSRQRDHVRVEC